MLFDLREADYGRAVRALDPERVNDLFDDPGSAAYLYIKVTHWAILIHDQPVLDAQFTIELVTVVTFLSIATHLETDLAEQVICKCLVDLKDSYRVCVIAEIKVIISLLTCTLSRNAA